MEPKTLIGILVAVVVVGGGVWYFSSHNAAVAPTEEGATGTTEEKAEGSATLADLMMRTGSFRCDVEMKAEATNGASESAGTVYISEGKMRGDFATKVSGMTINSYMISREGYVYTWSDMMPQGMKMKVATDGSTETTTQGAMDASAAVDYHCAPWSVDGSKFIVPSTVTFTELSA
ncbi:hypothetical protein K2Y00_01650 [Patescibacteria group bacterium]|nr:hypothetical protein [Patescibacteria group bacterium]